MLGDGGNQRGMRRVVWALVLGWLLVATPATRAADAGTEDRLVIAADRGSDTGDLDLFSLGLSGGDVRKLTDSPEWFDLFPKASLDGTRVVFQRHPTPTEGPNNWAVGPNDIWVINADGSGLRQLTDTPDVDEQAPALSPDGKRLAYYNANLGWVEIVDLESSRRTHLQNESSSSPDWSPDGRRIAYNACEWDVYPVTVACGLWIARADGSSPVERTRSVMQTAVEGICFGYVDPTGRYCSWTPRNDLSPAWSPDGRELVFWRWQAKDSDIYVINADDGSDPRPLIADPASNTLHGDAWPDWSPDGRRIAFARLPSARRCALGACGSADDWGLYVIAPDGTGERHITNPPGADDWQPTWTAAPTPSALPLAPPTVPSPGAAGASPSPVARLTIVSRTLRLSRRGTTAIRLRCMSTARVECRGRLELRASRRKLGLRSYRARPGRPASFRVRISATGRRLLARRRSLPVRIVAVTSEGALVGRRATLWAARRR